MYLNEKHRISTEQKLEHLSKMQPLSREEFIKQCKEGGRNQRELLMNLLAPRTAPSHSPIEKLEIARTCVAAQLSYYRKDPDCPPDDFVAMYQLNQLLLYSDSWVVSQFESEAISSRVHIWLETPASIAGVTLSVL